MSCLSENNMVGNSNIIKNENVSITFSSNVNGIKSEEKCEYSNNKNQNINEVWTKENFDSHKNQRKNCIKESLTLDLKQLKISWANKMNENEESDKQMEENEIKIEDKEMLSPTPSTPEKEIASPSHHARRPMNAFLIFCKKHRPIVRQRFPHLENRGVTRILGEWWALLDLSEKSSYTDLAKEYKDAFFSANPDFKWYKLPAPPLRTLNTRPMATHKIASPLASPTQISQNSTEFTPGKLADETQLGNLTKLMKSINEKTFDSSTSNTCEITLPNSMDHRLDNVANNNNNHYNINNNIEDNEEMGKHLLATPQNVILTEASAVPPKPIKKRKYEHFGDNDNKKVSRNIFDIKPTEELLSFDQNDNSCLDKDSDNFNHINCNHGCKEPENMTQQELMNKVVESMFPDQDNKTLEFAEKNEWNINNEKSTETRKSGRLCKGKRYAEFMVEGKLLGNKQTKRITQCNLDINNKFDNTLHNKIENMMHNKNETQTPKLNLGDTIKRLAERTNTKLENVCNEVISEKEINNKTEKRKRTESENSDDSVVKLQSDFNLDLRIAELPSLSYDTFTQRKKDSKKRKSVRSKSETNLTKGFKLSKSENNSLVGSKKRKNKNSITRLEKLPDSNYISDINNDLYGLATLAEIAANTEKLN